MKHIVLENLLYLYGRIGQPGVAPVLATVPLDKPCITGACALPLPKGMLPVEAMREALRSTMRDNAGDFAEVMDWSCNLEVPITAWPAGSIGEALLAAPDRRRVPLELATATVTVLIPWQSTGCPPGQNPATEDLVKAA